MASVADLKEQIILEVLLLGLRIGDVITLRVSELNKLEQEAPIELKLKATKEGTIYETFISQEFKELLQLYLPTVNGKCLFQGARFHEPCLCPPPSSIIKGSRSIVPSLR